MPDLWLPGAIHHPIPQGANDPVIVPVGDVFHVAVYEGDDLFGIFNNGSGIESTGYIRRDGSVVQYRPVNIECDAQADGNSWWDGHRTVGLNSWETQGMGEGEWTDAQIATIKTIINWKHHDWGTPLRVCPGPNAPGVGYHRLFPGWNPNGHSCPGPDRVRQFNAVLVPWMEAGAPATQEASDMQLSEKVGKGTDAPTVEQVLARLDRFMDNSADRDRRILTALSGLGPDVAAAVETELQGTAPGMDRTELRRVVEAATTRAINTRLGSLDEPAAKKQ